MSQIFITLIISFVIVSACLLMLGISSILTGKTRLRIGMCGRVPVTKGSKKDKAKTEQVCALCGNNGTKDKQDEDPLPKRESRNDSVDV